MMSSLLLVAMMACVCGVVAQTPNFPQPFSRTLKVESPLMTGADVIILQNLLLRASTTPKPPLSNYYDQQTAAAVSAYQSSIQLPATGEVDPLTATNVLADFSADGYKDDGVPAQELGYMYKVYVPVYQNRSIETNATLFAGNGTALLTFPVRAHGCDAGGCYPWPDFNNTNDGLNQFSSDGNTPTGLIEFDLNSPEDDPQDFGPYPVNRCVQGLQGNALFLMTNNVTTMIRDGILMHTGEWPNWSPGQPMPNSLGCIHSYPEYIYQVWQLLVSLGVQVRPNTDGALPYPYKPQGLISIEQLD